MRRWAEAGKLEAGTDAESRRVVDGAVLEAGVVVQSGTLAEISAAPASDYVERLVRRAP